MSEVRQNITAGWAFMRAGNARGALREFRAALGIDPESIEALTGLCQSHLDLNELREAGKTADDLLRLSPETAAAHRLKAETLRRGRSRGKALAFAQAAVKLEPEEAIGYHILAVVHSDLGQHRKALEAVAEGRKVAPWYGVLAAQEASILLQTKGPRAAEPVVREALRLAPDDTYVMTNAARVFLMAGKLEEARELAAHVLQRDANHESAVSIYLLTDPRRYRMLRRSVRFPYWSRDNRVAGALVWCLAWGAALLVFAFLVVVTHVPGIVVGLAYRGFWQLQYNAHRNEVKKHFAQTRLKTDF